MSNMPPVSDLSLEKLANLHIQNVEALADTDCTRDTRLFVAVVCGLPVCLVIDDRDPRDHDLSAGGMDIWLRYLGIG